MCLTIGSALACSIGGIHPSLSVIRADAGEQRSDSIPAMKIIVGFDGTDRAEDGLALARILAAGTGTVLLAHVVGSGSPMAPGWQQYESSLREDAAKMLDAAASMASAEGGYPRLETRIVTSSSPDHGLQKLAEAEQADLIALGSSHRGRIGRLLIGAVPERLLHGAPCAVAVAPRGFGERSKTALGVVAVALDGSPESKHALEFARGIAESSGATLEVLAVVEPEIIFGYAGGSAIIDHGELMEAQTRFLEKEVQSAVDTSPPASRAKGDLLSGGAAEALARRAENGIDLLVLGSRAYGPVRKVLLGSVSASLVRDAPCPLVIVPRPAGGDS
jgi:nucleotide-binding universal stress UspA family protein